MDRKHCCVCGEAIEGKPFIHGGRAFCATHHANVHQDRRGLWVSAALAIGGMILLTLAAWLVEKSTGFALRSGSLMLISAVMAIIPPFLWLGIFYRMDRLEPEPKAYITKVALLGALVQQAIYMPLSALMVPQSPIGGRLSPAAAFAALLLAAGLQELLKLFAVRYGVFATDEFDEKIDGIIYGSAAGLGFATMLNFQYILSAGGASLTASASNIVVTSLAHASFGGLTGYFLAVTKFEKKPYWWLPAGILGAVAGNVAVAELMELFVRRGFQVNHILGLIPAALVALAVFGVLLVIIRRDTRIAMADASGLSTDESELSAAAVEGTGNTSAVSVSIQAAEGTTASSAVIRRQIRTEGIILWGMAAVMLVGGLSFSLSSNAYRQQELSMLQVGLPSSWTGSTDAAGAYTASELQMPGNFGLQLTITEQALPEAASGAATTDEMLANLAAGWTMKSASGYAWYAPVDTRFKLVGGKPAAVVEYLYVQELSKRDGASMRPVQGCGWDVVVPVGERQVVISLTGDKDIEGIEETLDRILRSVVWN